MANVTNRFKIMDGPSHVTLHVYLASDGQSGELKNFCLLDPSDDLSPQMPRQQDLILKQVWYEVNGFNATLMFNSLNPWPAWTLTEGSNVAHDWRFFGGVRDYSSMPLFADADTPGQMTQVPQAGGPFTDPGVGGINSDGKLLVSTVGFTDVGDVASIVLWMEKRDRPNPQPV